MAKRAQRIFVMVSIARPSRPTVMASAAMDCCAALAVTKGCPGERSAAIHLGVAR